MGAKTPLINETLHDRSPLSSRSVRCFGTIFGFALLLAALAFVGTRYDTVADAVASLRSPRPELVASLLLCVLTHIMLSTLLFGMLTSRYGRVGAREMFAIVCATSLLNYLPLRAGTLGRIAYHRAYNNIRARDSIKVVVQAVLLSTAMACSVTIAVVIARLLNCSILLSLAAIPALLIPGLFPRRLRLWSAALVVRFVEIIVWAARYKCAFALIVADIDWNAALVLACMSTIINVVPFFSNGLGVREWAVGLVAPLLVTSSINITLELAVTAELLNRAAELLVVAVAGTLGMLVIGRRLRKASSTSHNAAAQPS